MQSAPAASGEPSDEALIATLANGTIGFYLGQPDVFITVKDRHDEAVRMVEARLAALRAEVEAGRRDVIRYDQTPDGCWVACIAGITGLPHDELAALVPRLESGRLDASMGTEYHNAVNAYLRARGWRLEGIGPDVPRGFAIGSGESPRGLSHAVVVKDGKLWHDPHPSRDGVKRVEFYEVLIPLTYSPAMSALSTPTSGPVQDA